MPWVPRYTREEAEVAISRSRSWADALRFLGLSPFGKNYTTLRKWATSWEIDSAHLPAYKARRSTPGFTEEQARAAIAASRSWNESLRKLGYCPTGGNPRTLKKWTEIWQISTDHFDPRAAQVEGLLRAKRRIAIAEILIEDSTYSRSNLKRRLYDEGLKRPLCELCGQDESWRGRRMGLILDHINGVRNDNRIENLRIVCPNCAATLDTHCGKRLRLEPRKCEHCDKEFVPKYRDHRYCSRDCGTRRSKSWAPRPGARRVERPSEAQLLAEIKRFGYLAVGRKYGVSDNAIRKWLLAYERERAAAEGRDPEVVEIPRRTWPNQRKGRRAA